MEGGVSRFPFCTSTFSFRGMQNERRLACMMTRWKKFG
jgi:hypothetical protein